MVDKSYTNKKSNGASVSASRAKVTAGKKGGNDFGHAGQTNTAKRQFGGKVKRD